jgi:ParB family chromosome partitioning protein
MMVKRAGGKSILANFGSFSQPEMAVPELAAAEASQVPAQPLARVGAGVIGATQRSLTELREERDRLKALVDAGGAADLDPRLIDPSPFPDRLPDDDDLDFEALKTLISQEGQKVPIQVRRHPSHDGRYQVVYGHRRWRAATDLGIRVKATILALSDAELVVAQGIENAARQDLSWVERALFAKRMDDAGIRSRDVRAALSVDDPELARLRAVSRALPVEIIQAIGRAPKVGRPRWTALATAVESDASLLARVRKTLSDDKVLALSSDERFKWALAAVTPSVERPRREIKLKSPAGKVVGRATFSGDEIRLSVATGHAPAFSAFIERELPGLIEQFFARGGDA